MAVKSRVVLVTTGVAGSGLESGATGATQQQRQTSFWAQQPHSGFAASGESVWADAITWSQITVRLRMMAAARFMVSIYRTYRPTPQTDGCDSCVISCRPCLRF